MKGHLVFIGQHATANCCRESLEKWHRIEKGINVGIGLNFGPVIACNLGSEERISYAVTGDTVNTAKRIESRAKFGKDSILFGESIYKNAHYLIITQALPVRTAKRQEDRKKNF